MFHTVACMKAIAYRKFCMVTFMFKDSFINIDLSFFELAYICISSGVVYRKSLKN